MNTQNLPLSDFVTWSRSTPIITKQGPRLLSTATPNKKFWELWRQDKAKILSQNVSVSKNSSGSWVLNHWGEVRQNKVITQNKTTFPCPKDLSYFNYQIEGIDFALNHRRCLIADEMGVGKTIQAVGLINSLAESKEPLSSILIVCPAGLRLNWADELERWLVHKRENILVVDSKPSQAKLNLSSVIIISYDLLSKYIDLFKKTFDLIILDEAHYIKNPRSKRTKACLSLKFNRVLCLTGTPLTNRPIELFPICQLTDPLLLGANFFSFARRYADAKQTMFGWDFTGASNLEELRKSLSRFTIRRTKSEILPELPPKFRQIIKLKVNGTSALIAQEHELIKKFGINDVKDLLGEKGHLIHQLSEIRQKIALSKLPAVVEHLKDLDEEPAVIFCYHHSVINELFRRLPEKSARIFTGKTSAEEKDQIVKDFQAGKFQFFIGQLKAAGTGLTLTRASKVIFVELDWTPGNMSQAEDRCHRIGQQDNVLIQHLLLDGSLDVNIARALIQKQKVIDAILN